MRLILAFLLLLTACCDNGQCKADPPEGTPPAFAGPTLMFEHEGCKVYFFSTRPGRAYEREHYYAHCTGPSTVMGTERTGKVEYPDSTPTAVGQ